MMRDQLFFFPSHVCMTTTTCFWAIVFVCGRKNKKSFTKLFCFIKPPHSGIHRVFTLKNSCVLFFNNHKQLSFCSSIHWKFIVFAYGVDQKFDHLAINFCYLLCSHGYVSMSLSTQSMKPTLVTIWIQQRASNTPTICNLT